MPIKDVLKETEAKMKKTIDSAKREFSEVRTGRAHPGLIEGLHVDYYGTVTLVKDIASISVPDPRSVVIQPWDINAIGEIEKAILKSNLGAVPSNDGKIIRLNIPPLSEERRKDLQKVVRDMAEHARISIRTVRRDGNDKIKKMKNDKTISEDDDHRAHESIQKLTDKYIKQIDDILHEKMDQLIDMN
jgi:ribosome recycling factor